MRIRQKLEHLANWPNFGIHATIGTANQRIGLYWRFIVLHVGGNKLTDNQGMHADNIKHNQGMLIILNITRVC